MFETLKNAWKVADIRKKLLFTLMIIVLYRLGSAIPVPFVDGAELSKYFENASVAGSLLGYFNLLSGDAFSKATLFALNILQHPSLFSFLPSQSPHLKKWQRAVLKVSKS